MYQSGYNKICSGDKHPQIPETQNSKEFFVTLLPEIWGYYILLGNWGLLSIFSVFKSGLRKGLGTILLEFKQKTTGQANCTPQKPPGAREEEARKPCLFKLSTEVWQAAPWQKGGSLR